MRAAAMSKRGGAFAIGVNPAGVYIVAVRDHLTAMATEPERVDTEIAELKAELDVLAGEMKAALLRKAARPAQRHRVDPRRA